MIKDKMTVRDQKTNILLPNNTVTPFGVSVFEDKASLLYRSKRRGHNKLSLAIAHNTVNFSEIDAPVLMANNVASVNISEINIAQLTHVLDKRVITYSKNGSLHIAEANDDSDIGVELWEVLKSAPKAEFGTIVPEFKHNNQYVIYHSKNNIGVSFSRDLKKWHGPNEIAVTKRAGLFDRNHISIFASQVINQGILVLYQSKLKQNKENVLSVGAVLFDKTNPNQVLWRSRKPLWQIISRKSDQILALGALIQNENIVIYFRNRSNAVFITSLVNPFASSTIKADRIQLERHQANPLIAPEGGGPWEAVGTFNPAVLQDDNKIHIMYRALDHAGMSRVGYASSADGITIDERHAEPAYWPRAAFEAGQGEPVYTSWSDEFASGGAGGAARTLS